MAARRRTDLTTPDLKMIVEALVFAADVPLKVDRLISLLEVERAAITTILGELQADYQESEHAFELLEVGGGYQFRTRPELAEYVQRLDPGRAFRLSRAALESLAIVAYRQPITRAEIDYLRGVDSGRVVKTLLEKRLIRILGKKEVPGRPLIYGTSRDFLEFFGLKDLSDLPSLKEFSELTPDQLAEGLQQELEVQDPAEHPLTSVPDLSD